MRKEFVYHLHKLMQENVDIWLITADLGFGLFDQIRMDYPDRFLNTGASEQAASDICVGLALGGKIPVMYSITPFLLYRCFETWRTYVNHEILHVILIGSGRDKDYEVDGFSHYAGDDWHLFLGGDELAILDNFESSWPKDSKQAIERLNQAIESDKPWYINLKR